MSVTIADDDGAAATETRAARIDTTVPTTLRFPAEGFAGTEGAPVAVSVLIGTGSAGIAGPVLVDVIDEFGNVVVAGAEAQLTGAAPELTATLAYASWQESLQGFAENPAALDTLNRAAEQAGFSQ